MLWKQNVDSTIFGPVIDTFRCRIDPRKNIAEFKW